MKQVSIFIVTSARSPGKTKKSLVPVHDVL